MNAAIDPTTRTFALFQVENIFRVVQSTAQRALREHLRDHRAHFDHFKSHFFFTDICPEHQDRFQVSFEECFDGSGSAAV